MAVPEAVCLILSRAAELAAVAAVGTRVVERVEEPVEAVEVVGHTFHLVKR